LGGEVVFVFGRGDAILVFVPVVVAQKPQVDIATFDFFEINVVGAAVFGWKVLEKKDLGHEAAHHGVA
jgi:hypothetical protein